MSYNFAAPNQSNDLLGHRLSSFYFNKTLSWLKVSRDSWKEKARESKTKLKIATLGVKRARESRDEIEKALHNRQKQLDQKDTEIAILKKKLEQAIQEVETLKKKR